MSNGTTLKGFKGAYNEAFIRAVTHIYCRLYPLCTRVNIFEINSE